jgi:hypothetical protein
MREFEKVRSAIIRGGTSKGVFIHASELPQDPKIRDEVILSIYGSDERQIDGLGGADSLTSKLAIVSPSSREDADVDYTFGQVGIGTGIIDYNSNCGNILSGVGPFAIDEGLVAVTEPFTTVRIYNTNTDVIVEAKVPVEFGKARSTGDFAIDGVPGTGAKIELNFIDADGSKTGALFPTGKRREKLEVENREIDVSIVDVTAPVVFVEASSIGLSGTELSDDLSSEDLLLLERIRSLAAAQLGFVADPDEATKATPSSPKVIVVSPPQDYVNAKGEQSLAEHIHLTARAMSMQKMHKTYPVTGGLCTATAAKLKGTIVHACAAGSEAAEEIVIGHPSGSMEFQIQLDDDGAHVKLTKTAVARTSRRIMEGHAYVPAKLFWSAPVAVAEEV